ncbi:uncharacterized protein isoform X1 [Danio rerio]|uniref:Uncharacterized protein LOC792896 isoform 1 n=3 Tax=Danio rerio TaxID=7955 RepID=A0A8M1P8C0_DANRE|nr:uncharacterized protein LOC792896 isoform 1 [Danio rerio]XP_021327310.1 uncharacterized protein LOC792896 isoform X1 [Danio rerio]|eukprot:NP_001314741.1 uncharacterized protein LOC792896 isoform 1 [Danio rerio]
MDEESESASEGELTSSTESDSLSEGNRKNKRKRAWRQTVSSNLTRESKLNVTCGDKKGILNLEKYYDMQECIFSEGRWFTPGDFEKFGGGEKSKKWKYSIRYNGLPLQKLIDINSAEFPPVADELRKRKIDSPESSLVTYRPRKRKCKQQRYSSSESERTKSDGEDDDSDNSVLNVFDFGDDDDDGIERSLDVTCGSASVSDSDSCVLHKRRFARVIYSESSMESDSDSYDEMEGGRRKMPERLCKKGPAKEVSFLSGFESEICPDSSMASDSENYEKYEEREDERSKVADRLSKKGPSRDYRPNHKRAKNQLPVTCGEKEGILCLRKYNNVQPCILSEGQWFTPSEFERFGKKERNKKWKISIFYHKIPLQTFIEDGLLSSQQFHHKKSRVQTENEQGGRELSSSDSDSEHSTDAPEPAGSSDIEEADQTSEEQEAAAADPMSECQNPIDLQETPKTDQMQLIELLAKRFNTMNNALKSVDSSIKTFMKK